MDPVSDDGLKLKYDYCDPNILYSVSNETRSPDDEAVEKVEKILYGILMPVLSALGITGNILNLVVLTRPNLMKIITYTYFRAMAISDLLTMVMVIPFVAELSGAGLTSYGGYLFHAHFVLPCLNALVGCSVMSIVAVTFERWLSICHPLQAKNIQSPLRAKTIIAGGWMISFSLYLPYCFRKYVMICTDPITENVAYFVMDNVAFSQSRGYFIYGWIRETILRLLPMFLLAVLNLRIVFGLRKVQSRRRKLKGSSLLKPDLRRPSAPDGNIRDSVSRLSMSSTPAAKAEHRRLQEERRLLVLLIGIVVMFFICVTPAAILLILPVADEDFGLGLKLFRAVANLLELTNYALNFYVYVGCSSDFRTTFVSVFCNKWVKRQENGDYERSLTAIKATGSRKGTIEITAPGSGSSTPLMRPRNGVDGQNNVNVVRTMDKQDVLKV